MAILPCWRDKQNTNYYIQHTQCTATIYTIQSYNIQQYNNYNIHNIINFIITEYKCKQAIYNKNNQL